VFICLPLLCPPACHGAVLPPVGQCLDSLAIPQRMSLYALGSDALDLFGKDGFEGMDLDSFLGIAPGTNGSSGNTDMVAPIAPGSRTTVNIQPNGL